MALGRPSPGGHATGGRSRLVIGAAAATLAGLALLLFSALHRDSGSIRGPQLGSHAAVSLEGVREAYLDLLRDSVTGTALKVDGVQGVANKPVKYAKERRDVGDDWPQFGYCMSGVNSLNSVRQVLKSVFERNVPGDWLEAGVWRGGTSVFARGMMKVYGQEHRNVWVVDSFEGLPAATGSVDSNIWSKLTGLEVSVDQVRGAFESYGLYDRSKVHFIKGYFVESLPSRYRDPTFATQLAVLRLDGDMYESYMDCFYNLFDRVSVGGVIILDDYNLIPVAQQATDDFRERHGITDPITFEGDEAQRPYWIKLSMLPNGVDYKWYEDFVASRDLTRMHHKSGGSGRS